jgi:hypothetical protein
MVCREAAEGQTLKKRIMQTTCCRGKWDDKQWVSTGKQKDKKMVYPLNFEENLKFL